MRFTTRSMVPGGGVEPPRGCPRRILSPLRLPVPPSRLGEDVPNILRKSAGKFGLVLIGINRV